MNRRNFFRKAALGIFAIILFIGCRTETKPYVLTVDGRLVDTVDASYYRAKFKFHESSVTFYIGSQSIYEWHSHELFVTTSVKLAE